MKVTLTHDGKSVELDLTAEQMTALGLKEEKKKTGYERVEYGKRCFRVFGDSTVSEDGEYGHINDDYYSNASYYSDEKLACANARADKLMRQLRRFAAENGGIPSVEDWKDPCKDKYTIKYHYPSEKLECSSWTLLRLFGLVFFNSEDDCRKAIAKFYDELIWYFTEYEAMLR